MGTPDRAPSRATHLLQVRPLYRDHGALGGVLASNRIVPLEPSLLVYEIASRPNMKPSVRTPPSCWRNRTSTEGCSSGQAIDSG